MAATPTPRNARQVLARWSRALTVWGQYRSNGLLLDAAVVLMVLIAAGAVYSWRWLELFPLIEFREQSNFHLSLSWLWDQITLDGPNIWSVPYLFNSTVGDVCGIAIGCTNAILMAINLVSAALLYALVRRLAGWRVLSMAAAVLWLASLPVLDSLAWQATNLDKLSLLFVLVGMHIALSYYRRRYTLERCLVANGVLLLVVVLAHNCKPAAWVIVPGMLLLPVIGGGQRAWTWICYLLAPGAYAVIQAGYVLRSTAQDPFTLEHVYGGDPVGNVTLFAGYLTGSLSATVGGAVFLSALTIVVIVGLVRRVPHARAGAWAYIVFGGALAMPARTLHASAFYMLVPAAFLAILSALALLVAIELTGRRWVAVPVIGALVFVSVYSWNLATSRAAYGALQVQSHNFRASFPAIAAAVSRNRVRALLFVVPEDNFLAYRFAPRDVEQYIWGSKTDFDDRISLLGSQALRVRGLRRGETAVKFDAAMRLIAIDRGPIHPQQTITPRMNRA